MAGSVHWIGLDKAQRAVRAAPDDLNRAARIGVTAVTNDVAARSDELVPFDTGNLSQSQTIDTPSPGGRIVGEVGYGGSAAPYALVQHEDLTLSHPPKTEGGRPVEPGQGRGPKYLEYAAGEFANGELTAEIIKALQLGRLL